ncbi:RNA polymerase II mediator complex component SRB4 [Drechmeria coniospora]|uniref:Mediator of RNA polymerase II transcription subunit 17 n=1 Tax=Drechmeria coniospora TaxID=98403 RepID=A0A151GLF9_DRECN|nr:RNA polymerase II mediator complex component SRB4 [Drechmeria coniospora]KYK57943.1 RNA polymerase II mediator complex component SRB4 [Drechmeria coniospora]ODA83213.1 hypothetical protein RJ55_01724 [Drechmeria coniospora]
MASNDGPPLSLRPFPVADNKSKSIGEFVARVNAQPGGFRALTADKLREEIKISEENGVAGPDGDAMSDDDDQDGVDNDDDDEAAKDPLLARLEVLKNLDVAGNTAMLTLDTLSLLLSKQNPTHAGLTLSQQLRDMVGIGTLGADKLGEPTVNEARTKEQAEVAIGWTLMEIDKARNAAREATAFLDREVAAESKYWEDVLAVKQAGWSVCKVPKERNTLGVRFGFSEAAPEFKSNSLAPMRRGDDGAVELDLDRLGGVSEGLVVTYEKNGKVVGRSVPRRRRDDTSLEHRILEARNTIFTQELWHELTRESRALMAYDVRFEGRRLLFDVDKSTRITFELLSLDSCPADDSTLPESDTAEAISSSLHILLSYAHRYNELMRTRPLPPHVSRSRGQQTYTLLRPIIARAMYMLNVRACTRHAANLVKAIRKTGLPASFALHTTQACTADAGPGGPNQPSATQTLIRHMLQPLEFTIRLTILADTSLTIRGRTFLLPFTGSYYHVHLPADSPLKGSDAPLADGYSTLAALADYTHAAVARSLGRHAFARLVRSFPKVEWSRDMIGTSIRDGDADDPLVHLSVESRDAYPAIVLAGVVRAQGRRDLRTWTWTSSEQEASESQTLEESVDEIASRATS